MNIKIILYFSLWRFSAWITARNWSVFLFSLIWIYLGIKLCFMENTSCFQNDPSAWLYMPRHNESIGRLHTKVQLSRVRWDQFDHYICLHRRVNTRPRNYSITTVSTTTAEFLPRELIRATIWWLRTFSESDKTTHRTSGHGLFEEPVLRYKPLYRGNLYSVDRN